MADLTPNAVPVFQDGKCSHAALFSINNVNAGDTVDLAAWFLVVKRAGIVSALGNTIAGISTIANGASGTPTMLTIPAGPTQDAIWLIAVGAASTGVA